MRLRQLHKESNTASQHVSTAPKCVKLGMCALAGGGGGWGSGMSPGKLPNLSLQMAYSTVHAFNWNFHPNKKLELNMKCT